MTGTRSALIVATYAYEEEGLARLRAPERDADELVEVLGDPAIGNFDVTAVINQSAYEISLAVAHFFADRRADDVLLLHFSCHGVKDDSGELYLAAKNTRLDLLDPTALSSTFVRRAMDRTRAGRVVLLLDCCYAGAFGRGMRTRAGGQVDIKDRLSGRGRAVIAASSALEFAFEGTDLADGEVKGSPSVFTGALVQGLRTGEADRDQDGWVSLDELYAYVHDEVRRVNPNQNPKKWALEVEGDFHVARRGGPVTKPSELHESIKESMGSHFWWERKSAVEPLAELLEGDHPGLALAASQGLQVLATDPDDRVKAAARALLSPDAPIAAEVEPVKETPPRVEPETSSETKPTRPSIEALEPSTGARFSGYATRRRIQVAGVLAGLGIVGATGWAAQSLLTDGGRDPSVTPSAPTETGPPPASTSEPVADVICWDGEAVETASSCDMPVGKAGFASAFPSFDKRCRSRRSVAAGKLEVWECKYEFYLVRYSRWDPSFDRFAYYNSVNPDATEREWFIDGDRAGTSWTSYENDANEPEKFQWSAAYDDAPYSISVESQSETGRAQGVGRLSFKSAATLPVK